MPYFGGADGRVALRLLLQLAENPQVTATVVHYPSLDDDHTPVEVVTPKSPNNDQASRQRTHSAEDDAAFFLTMQRSLNTDLESRFVFDTATASSTPVQSVLARGADRDGSESQERW